MSSNSQKKILFFGGSFDPIHLGHLNLVIQIQEKFQFDQVLLCPNYCSPHKQNTPPKAAPEHRLKMIDLVIQPLKNFVSLDWEVRKKSICYTVDTLTELSEKYASSSLFFLMAEDPVIHFSKWKDPKKILTLASPIIGARQSFFHEVKDHIPQEIFPQFQKGFSPTKIMEISSTDIRERLKENLYCGHLVSQIVLDYITSHDLY